MTRPLRAVTIPIATLAGEVLNISCIYVTFWYIRVMDYEALMSEAVGRAILADGSVRGVEKQIEYRAWHHFQKKYYAKEVVVNGARYKVHDVKCACSAGEFREDKPCVTLRMLVTAMKPDKNARARIRTAKNNFNAGAWYSFHGDKNARDYRYLAWVVGIEEATAGTYTLRDIQLA